jgi:hypothetical protein
MRHRSESLGLSLSKFRLFGRWRVSRVEWRAPREASHCSSRPPPRTPLNQRHTSRQPTKEATLSHEASDDFTPAVRTGLLLCCVSSRATITLLPTSSFYGHRHSPQACRAIATSCPFPSVEHTTYSSPTRSNHTFQQNTTNTQTPSHATWRSLMGCAKMLLHLSSHMRVASESCRCMLPS